MVFAVGSKGEKGFKDEPTIPSLNYGMAVLSLINLFWLDAYLLSGFEDIGFVTYIGVIL